MSVTAIIRLHASSGQGDALQRAFSTPLEEVRQHPTCFSAHMYANCERAAELLLLEEWESAEDHQKYVAEMRASGEVDALMRFMAGPPETTYLVSVE